MSRGQIDGKIDQKNERKKKKLKGDEFEEEQ